MIWNTRSLNDISKKIYLVDIISNNNPDIIILTETFLLDEANLFIKKYKTYKTRNILKRNGVAILIHKNLLVSVLQLNNDVNGRFIKLSIKTPGLNESYTISGVYLEPKGDKKNIPEEIFDSNIIAGDLNEFKSELNRYGVYHYKNIKILSELKINNKISDHNILFGEALINVKRTELYSNIDILDKNKINTNKKEILKSLENNTECKLINPHKTIKINNYKINPNNLNIYEDWEKVREQHKEQYNNKYNRINKIITSGNIDNDTWTLINKTFITKPNKEIYTGDHLKKEIIEYYKDIYESNVNRTKLERSTFLNKIMSIITILLNDPNTTNKRPIWPPKSSARDFNGFSQKDIEKIIRAESLRDEIIKLQILFGKICEIQQSSELFIHQVSKSILFKKKNNIKGGTDIRVINILPAWLSITEKLSLAKVKEILSHKIDQNQFGFKEGSDCNIAKLLTWYNSNKLGFKKNLLIDIKKAFDSIKRNELKNMIQSDFINDEKNLLLNFIDIYDNISLNILGETINPTRGGPQGSSIVPLLFCYYINKAIIKCGQNTQQKLQLYADDIIVQTKTCEDLNNTYKKLKAELNKISLVINTEKCEIISDDPNDIIKDDQNGQIIIPKNKGKYLGQIINNKGLTENIIKAKIFGKLINHLNLYNGFTRATKIRIFKTYLISKVNHLLPLIALTGNLDISWKTIRKIIFRYILNGQTTPLETAIASGIGYYNIIIRPLIKLIGRYKNIRTNENEEKCLKEAAINAISYWIQTEKKHTDEETKTLQKIINNELWLNEKELDQLLYNQQATRPMRNNSTNLNLNNPKILKFPCINYYLSNAPYDEIIDTSASYENTNSDKQKHIKFERTLKLTIQLSIGKETALLLTDENQKEITIPNFNESSNIMEEMTILEAQIQCSIEKIKEPKEKEAEDLIKELTNIIQIKLKEKEENKINDIEFHKLRNLHNIYRDKV